MPIGPGFEQGNTIVMPSLMKVLLWADATSGGQLQLIVLAQLTDIHLTRMLMSRDDRPELISHHLMAGYAAPNACAKNTTSRDVTHLFSQRSKINSLIVVTLTIRSICHHGHLLLHHWFCFTVIGRSSRLNFWVSGFNELHPCDVCSVRSWAPTTNIITATAISSSGY